MAPTWGWPNFGRYCWVKLGKVSLSSRRDDAAIVSNTSDDLPEPDSPTKAVTRYLGMVTLTCLRLFCRASCTPMKPCGN